MALYREQVPPLILTFNQQLLSIDDISFISTQAIFKVVLYLPGWYGQGDWKSYSTSRATQG